MVEGRVAVGEGAAFAREIDSGEIEARAAGQRQAVGRVERVERIEADIGVGRLGRDRVQKAVRLVDDVGEADDRQGVVDEPRNDAELAVAGEVRPAVVERRADGEGVVVAADLVGVDRLRGPADRCATGSRSDRSRRGRSSRSARCRE